METRLWKLNNSSVDDTLLQEAAQCLRDGEVVAFPTETVYGLGADGLNDKAVHKIFKAKGRPVDNPLILHIAQFEDLELLAREVSPLAKKLAAAFWPGPLTLIVKKTSIVPDSVSAGLDSVAVRMPVHPIAQRLIHLTARPLAAPSANKSGRPSPTDAKAVSEDLAGLIAGIIDGGPAKFGVESTVVDTTGRVPIILRPGSITKEMLEKVVGEVLLDPAVLGNTAVVAKAPGMKYRHYAPVAPMFLFVGTNARAAIASAAATCVKQGLKPAVLLGSSLQLAGVLAKNWQNDSVILAKNLYSWLREFDRAGSDIILAEGLSEDELGLAVMNRLRKAAGNNILRADLGQKLFVQNGTEPLFL
ncbi:MAG TPA: threonylcarbamoyl-AMP synthase [Candidatus Avacidaminococcus intestinavium]|uniref:Threonylcarbamoyl-AMP synthase n=1 Tax=Candidatus Avacidaminococcus intestinavium TaxID=2840684 RepID=A0A9D1SM25_9FIRM|nr:threonylcarbamoyl-AMP synthase [Candidatus Avacidaminococcus intestinavium]